MKLLENLNMAHPLFLSEECFESLGTHTDFSPLLVQQSVKKSWYYVVSQRWSCWIKHWWNPVFSNFYWAFLNVLMVLMVTNHLSYICCTSGLLATKSKNMWKRSRSSVASPLTGWLDDIFANVCNKWCFFCSNYMQLSYVIGYISLHESDNNWIEMGCMDAKWQCMFTRQSLNETLNEGLNESKVLTLNISLA